MKREILSLRHVCLSRDGEEQLSEVTFSLYEGDVLGLISLDNQGLDALVELVLHNRRLDRGHLFFAEKEVSSYLGCTAKENKAAVVESVSHLIPALNLADMFFFAKKKGPLLVHRAKLNRQIRMIFEPYGMKLTGAEYPDQLSALDRCRVEIIKAKTFGCKVIVVREPSSFLSAGELACLHLLIRKLAAEDGIACMYLCNHHREVMSVCSRLAVMYAGTVVLNKASAAVTERMMSVVSEDFIKSITGLPRPAAPAAEPLATIRGKNGFALTVFKGECLVLLDLDNKTIPRIADALFARTPFAARRPEYRVFIDGTEAYRNPLLWSFIPAEPAGRTLFYDLSYIDNLTLKNSSRKLPHFWLFKRYRAHVCGEYRRIVGDVAESGNLYQLGQRELYELIYLRAGLERPKVLFIVQPFIGMGMYQRIRILEYISQLRRAGITVVILAVSLSDSLQAASRLILLQDGRIEKELPPERFDQAASYGLVVR
ncbi:monosaccharide-transporting ATPase [Treponema brennaborense]|uniref:Monosaccharide-transporting ATPase n=1 Tax=Treponema brennaborense (strain DSM 12168 / CIP 105900 / DD5/3) TaxID=906968 RepID=F4LLJ4_TREBD|nr:monosaccharide-transporting ATPase [Treponema brennaborense]AEE16658.1 monosaccharide-transporting ATPase [Treponema brennaborense DSM 12168]